MRIAIWHNLPSGGGKRQLYNHVQGLLRRGHEIQAWCPDTADQKFLPLSDVIRERVIPLRGTTPLFRDPRRPGRVTRVLLDAMEEHCRACAEEIKAGQFDVLFANGCVFLRSTPIAGYVPIPSVLYLNEPYRWFYEAMPQLPWIAPRAAMERRLSARLSLDALREYAAAWSSLGTIRLQARAELEYTRRFDLVLANSVFSRETILRTYNIDSRLCYLGIDTTRYVPTGEPKEAFVVGLGTIYHGKGVDRAIRALGTLPAGKRPALVWVGNGSWPEDLQDYQRLAARLGVEFSVKEHISDHEVISLLSRATAMIYTSRLEPFGLAPLEANACGTPVVGIAEGGIKETVRDGVNGFLAVDDDPQAMGELLLRFVDSPDLVKTMGARAREYVMTEWNLERATDNLERHLKTLARDKYGKTLLADRAKLQALVPTGNVRCYVEDKTISGRTLRIRGWAHIDDGQHATGAEIYLLVRNGSEAQVIRTTRRSRPDVTQHFGGGIDYDDSGFSADAAVTIPAPYELGIVVVRGGDVAMLVV